MTKQQNKFIAKDEDTRDQFGALCWRMHLGRVEVLLITSRDTGRWVIPKGWPMQGIAPAKAAAIEAWEEAGVEGQVEEKPVGSFNYSKVFTSKADVPCVVTVYPLHVSRLAKKFPERKERRRKWFDAQKAARKVIEPELRALLSQISHDHAVMAQHHDTSPAASSTDVDGA